jgi:antitoxin component YwqK of YwqJK toxin-antitoxin module
MSDTPQPPEKVVLKDAEGNVTEEVFLKDGALEGEAVLYSAGRVRARIPYRGGKQQGTAAYYDETGQVSMKMNYATGQLDGESLFFDHEGKLVRRAFYVKDQLQGRTIDYHPSGKVRTVWHYRAGILHGEVWEYGDDGKLQNRRCFHEGKPYPCPQTKRPG